MISRITSKLEVLLQESIATDSSISMSKYSLSCGNVELSSDEYELSVDEEGLLDFIYQADHLQFSREVASIIKNRISLAEQKSFFTKLFIYETLVENETSFIVPYSEYITKLNTGFTDEKQKTVSDLIDIYASDKLKNDTEFNETIKKLKSSKIVSDSNYIEGYNQNHQQYIK